MGRLREFGATLVEKVNIAAGNHMVAAWAIIPPAIAIAEKVHINGPIAGVYAFLLGATASRRYEQYGEVSRKIQKGGYDAIELQGEKKRLAQIYAERHRQQQDFRNAVDRYKRDKDNADYYGNF